MKGRFLHSVITLMLGLGLGLSAAWVVAEAEPEPEPEPEAEIATVVISPEALLLELNQYPHAQQIAVSEQQVIDHEIGLGALQKVRGSWRFKKSERHSGLLTRYTWQIIDGFTSNEVLGELLLSLREADGSQEIFSCDGRACGHGSQWANRIFHQRVLYGREDLQRYRVYTLARESEYRLVIYSASRTADRQYLHVELLRITQNGR